LGSDFLQKLTLKLAFRKKTAGFPSIKIQYAQQVASLLESDVFNELSVGVVAVGDHGNEILNARRLNMPARVFRSTKY
jgi:hypothetical protein